MSNSISMAKKLSPFVIKLRQTNKHPFAFIILAITTSSVNLPSTIETQKFPLESNFQKR